MGGQYSEVGRAEAGRFFSFPGLLILIPASDRRVVHISVLAGIAPGANLDTTLFKGLTASGSGVLFVIRCRLCLSHIFLDLLGVTSGRGIVGQIQRSSHFLT